MDPEFIKWLATLGIGGVLAGFIFVFYRKDIRSYTELWKTTSELLMKVVNENTASNVKIVEHLEIMERTSLTVSDLREFCQFRPGNRKEEVK